jgi:hypothetical protein
MRLIFGAIVFIVLLAVFLGRRRRQKHPEGWITAEEAAERQERMREKWADISAQQGGKLTEAQSTESFAEIMKAGEMGFVDYPGTSLTITMRLASGPIDRYVQFEEPLGRALGELGITRGGGSFRKRGPDGEEFQEFDIGVVVKDVDRGLAIIREVLKTQGAPKETRILQREPVERDFPLYE